MKTEKKVKKLISDTLLYAILRLFVNPLFRLLYLVSWIIMIVTFITAIPIYVVAFILFKENSDLFSDTIYDKWFEPMHDFLLNGI